MRLTEAEYVELLRRNPDLARRIVPLLGRNNGKAIPAESTKATAPNDGFDSEAERERFGQLWADAQEGKISDLRRQVEFELLPDFTDGNGAVVKGIKYTCDFMYTLTATGTTIIEEVKARKKWSEKRKQYVSFTDKPDFRLRWKLLKYKFRHDPNIQFKIYYTGSDKAKG